MKLHRQAADSLVRPFHVSLLTRIFFWMTTSDEVIVGL
jgi:hypothetical protein